MLQDVVSDAKKSLGWNIKTAAERCGMHRQQFTDILNGKIRDPRLSTLKRLSTGLGLSMDQLAEINHDHRGCADE